MSHAHHGYGNTPNICLPPQCPSSFKRPAFQNNNNNNNNNGNDYAKLTNELKLSEGASCVDYHDTFRALLVGSTRQLHVVEVLSTIQENENENENNNPPTMAPFLLKNTGSFGGLLKVESIKWYPSPLEASLAFIQTGKGVTIFLDALQFKFNNNNNENNNNNTISFLPQQWRSTSNGSNDKSLKATQHAGKGVTTAAFVSPLLYETMLPTSATNNNNNNHNPNTSSNNSTSLLTSSSLAANNNNNNFNYRGTPQTPMSSSTDTVHSNMNNNNNHNNPFIIRSEKGILAKEIIELQIPTGYTNIEKMVWQPLPEINNHHNIHHYQPYTLLLSSPITYFELWTIPQGQDGQGRSLIYPPQLLLRPPAHQSGDVVRDIAFAPQPHVFNSNIQHNNNNNSVSTFFSDGQRPSTPIIIVLVEGSLTGGCLLFYDPLQVEVPYRIPLEGPGLCFSLHPYFKDVLAVSYRKEKTRTNSHIAFYQFHSNFQELQNNNNQNGQILEKQDVLKPIHHYSCVSKLAWRPTVYTEGQSYPSQHCYQTSMFYPEKLLHSELHHLQKTSNEKEINKNVLFSQLWFATTSLVGDVDISIWDSLYYYNPLATIKFNNNNSNSNKTKSTKEAPSDFCWINPFTIVSVFKSGEMVLTSLLQNFLGSSENPHHTPFLAKIKKYRKVDYFSNLFSYISILSNAAVIADFNGVFYTVRGSNKKIIKYYMDVLFFELLIFLENEIQRKRKEEYLRSECDACQPVLQMISTLKNNLLLNTNNNNNSTMDSFPSTPLTSNETNNNNNNSHMKMAILRGRRNKNNNNTNNNKNVSSYSVNSLLETPLLTTQTPPNNNNNNNDSFAHMELPPCEINNNNNNTENIHEERIDSPSPRMENTHNNNSSSGLHSFFHQLFGLDGRRKTKERNSHNNNNNNSVSRNRSTTTARVDNNNNNNHNHTKIETKSSPFVNNNTNTVNNNNNNSITRYGPSAEELFKIALETNPIPLNNNNKNKNDIESEDGIHFFSIFSSSPKTENEINENNSESSVSSVNESAVRDTQSISPNNNNIHNENENETNNNHKNEETTFLTSLLAEEYYAPWIELHDTIDNNNNNDNWCYIEKKEEEELFIKYVLGWENGFEILLLLRQQRMGHHPQNNNNNIQNSNNNNENYKEKKSKVALLLEKVFEANPNENNEKLNRKIDRLFSKMALKNGKICEEEQIKINEKYLQKKEMSKKKKENLTDSRLASHLRNNNQNQNNNENENENNYHNEDQRASWWAAVADAFLTHHLDFILHVISSLLEYAALMGDGQFCFTVYGLLCVWWRVRFFQNNNNNHNLKNNENNNNNNETKSVFRVPCPFLPEQNITEPKENSKKDKNEKNDKNIENIISPQEWRLRALQWLDQYILQLLNYQLYASWNELLLLVPELFLESGSNPILPRAVDMLYERQMTYVYCGHCGQQELQPSPDRMIKEIKNENNKKKKKKWLSIPQNAACEHCSHQNNNNNHNVLPTCALCEETVTGHFLWWRCGHGGHIQHCLEWINHNNSGEGAACPVCGATL